MASEIPELKPVERSVLIAMATAGGKLHQTADIRQRLRLNFTREHREKLISLGLIRNNKNSVKSLELTGSGWAWAQSELVAEKPAGTMGLGTLYAVLADLRRVLDARGESLQSFFLPEGDQPRAPADAAPTGAVAFSPDASEPVCSDQRMGEAAWAEADNALAMALQDIPSFSRMLDRARSLPGPDSNPKFETSLRQIELSADQVFQSVRRAASRRDLQVQHIKGEIVAFDAAAYEANDLVSQAEKSLVVKPAVTRNVAGIVHVIARGIVDPC